MARVCAAERVIGDGRASPRRSASRRGTGDASEASGSWKIIAICVPADVAHLVGREREQVAPVEDDPAGDVRALRAREPDNVSAATLLPEPDSPTMPIDPPGSTVNEIPSTACTTPSGVGNSTRMSSTVEQRAGQLRGARGWLRDAHS